MVKVKIKNSYHNSIEIKEGKNLEEIKQNHNEGLEVLAEWLAENEVEEDWHDYYSTYEQAFNDTYELIFEQLKSEVSFTVIEELQK